MKKINILACFLAFQISYPAPSGIFSVTATEEISDALLENINSELKQLSNTKNFAVDSHAELSISKENKENNLMLINELGAISYSKKLQMGQTI